MPDPLQLLPAWAWTLATLGSLLLALLGVLALPRVVARLPADWFVRPPIPLRQALRLHPVKVVGRNLVGLVLLVLGVLMLVLPGQGVLTLLVGLLLTDLPVRRRLIGLLVRRRTLARALQRLRAWADAPPFVGLPGAEEPPVGRAGGAVD